jgi:hypothetical protein
MPNFSTPWILSNTKLLFFVFFFFFEILLVLLLAVNSHGPFRLRLGLGNCNTQDSILQARPHGVLIDACREGKAAVEGTNTTLANPVLGLRRSVGVCVDVGGLYVGVGV